MISDHIAEAQLSPAAEHELEPFPHQLLRHEKTGREAISLPFRRGAGRMQWTAIKGAVAVHVLYAKSFEEISLLGASFRAFPLNIQEMTRAASWLPLLLDSVKHFAPQRFFYLLVERVALAGARSSTMTSNWSMSAAVRSSSNSTRN